MNVFEVVKRSVTTREVAQMYGIKVGRNGMACCPFHNDKHPSMKLDKRFHCFGCQEDGDAVDFVSKLYGLPCRDAAIKIAEDFGLSFDLQYRGRIKPRIREPDIRVQLRDKMKIYDAVISRYLFMIREWEEIYSPKSMEEEFHPLFVEALQNKDYMMYLLELIFDSKEEDMQTLEKELRREVEKIERRITEYHRDRSA